MKWKSNHCTHTHTLTHTHTQTNTHRESSSNFLRLHLGTVIRFLGDNRDNEDLVPGENRGYHQTLIIAVDAVVGCEDVCGDCEWERK